MVVFVVRKRNDWNLPDILGGCAQEDLILDQRSI